MPFAMWSQANPPTRPTENYHADVATVTNMLEWLNQESKGRTLVIRIFPNEEEALCDSSGPWRSKFTRNGSKPTTT